MSAFSRRFGLLALAIAAGYGCQSRPQDLPAELQSALLRRDWPAVLALVDRDSRPLVEAAMDAEPRADSPYWLRAKPAPTHVVKTEPGESGLLLTVESAGVTRDWALVQEGGAWKIDLAATASHRAWDVSARDAK